MINPEKRVSFTKENQALVSQLPELSVFTVALDLYTKQRQSQGSLIPPSYARMLFSQVIVNDYPRGSLERKIVGQAPWIKEIMLRSAHPDDIREYRQHIEKVKTDLQNDRNNIFSALTHRQNMLLTKQHSLFEDIRSAIIARSPYKPGSRGTPPAPDSRVNNLTSIFSLIQQGRSRKDIAKQLGLTEAAIHTYASDLISLGFLKARSGPRGHIDATKELDEIHKLAREDYPQATRLEMAKILTSILDLDQEVTVHEVKNSVRRLVKEKGVKLKKPPVSESLDVVKEEIRRQAEDSPEKPFNRKMAQEHLGLSEDSLRRRLKRLNHE